MFTQTGVYQQPCIAYGAVSGIAVPGSTNPFEIPLILTVYSSPNEKAIVGTNQTIAITDRSGFAFGGAYGSFGSTPLPRVQLEGTIDTPLVSATEDNGTAVMLPAITVTGVSHTVNMHWPDVIAMLMMGRGQSILERIDPVYFRDPFGRKFTSVRILDFTATHIEGAPGRMNFTMQLKI